METIFKSYPKMSVLDFNKWITFLYERYADEDQYFIMSVLMNDEVSNDEELRQHLVSNDANPTYVDELIKARNYFFDFRYVKDINFN